MNIKEQLASKANKLVSIEIEGVTLFVKTLSLKQMKSLGATEQTEDDKIAKLIVSVVCQEDGEPVFENAEELNEMSSVILQEIIKKILEVNGVDVNQLKKN